MPDTPPTDDAPKPPQKPSQKSPQKQTRKATTLAKRMTIVEAAIRLFVDKGFHAASIRDIAAEAGISLGNLYNHFSGKAGLIEEIAGLEAADLDRIERALFKTDTPRGRLETLTWMLHSQLADRDSAMLTAEIMAESLRNPAIAASFSENRDRLLEMVSGQLPPREHDPITQRDRAEAILDLIEGDAFRQILAGCKDPTADKVCALVVDLAGY